jgi:hypothetical protein
MSYGEYALLALKAAMALGLMFWMFSKVGKP